jgi:hypothetical protein
VVVLLPEDGSVRAVLDGGLLRSRWMSPCRRRVASAWPTGRPRRDVQRPPRPRRRLPGARRESAGDPAACRGDDRRRRSVLVADASHGRLRFDPEGKSLADVPLTPLVKAAEGGDIALGAGEGVRKRCRAPGRACEPPLPARDGGVRLAGVHRALRLLALRLAHAFETTGTFVSTVLDGGTPGTVWHRVEVEADLPEGTRLTVETATADDPVRLDPPAAALVAARDRDGRLVPVTAAVADQLVSRRPVATCAAGGLALRRSGDAEPTPCASSTRE